MRSFLFVLVAASLVVPASALACWDGYRAELGRVEVMGGDEGDAWKPSEVRERVIWLARIDALVPDGGSVLVEWQTVTATRADGTAVEQPWTSGSYPGLFRIVAHAFTVDAATERAARALQPDVWTVQVGAYLDTANAEAHARAIEEQELGEHGVVEVGGFPANNPTAHVVSGTNASGAAVDRVVIGAFASRAVAERVAAELGTRAFVRTL